MLMQYITIITEWKQDNYITIAKHRYLDDLLLAADKLPMCKSCVKDYRWRAHDNPGHFGSSFQRLEPTVASHYVFNTP